MTESPDDSAARESARDIRRNIQLQAPAGSGKTTVLAQRFLAALAVADEPEEVLAITFTRKAAAEMRERVLAALDDALPPGHPEREQWQALRAAVHAQAARHDWPLPELPQRLRIQTIDSLAAELARTMPVLGRMQSSLRVIDDATSLYVEAARRTLREGDADAGYHADVNLLLERLDNNVDRAQQLLAGLLPGRNRWQQLLFEHPPSALAEQLLASLQRIIESSLGALSSTLPRPWLEEAALIAREAARNRLEAGHEDGGRWQAWLMEDAALGIEARHLHCWQALAELLLLGDEDRLRSQVNVRNGFPKGSALKLRWQSWRDELEACAGALPLLAGMRALPEALLDADERRTIAALARVLLLAGAQLKLVFRERGLLDHAEVAAIARQGLRALGEESGFPLRQTLRVSHLLVDECQDTSPDQLELVDELTSGWQRGDARSLFLVGDPMQSIYLFRDSEVGLFLQTRERGLGQIRLEPLRLTRNFRSQPELVQWANTAFAGIFPAVEDLRSSAVTFLPARHARTRDGRIEAAVTFWPQPADDAASEARAIATEISLLRTAQPDLSIAILLQTRALAAPILRALQAAAVPALGLDLAALADRPVVRDLVALGSALLDAGDRSSWLAVLRSPPCGLLLDDLRCLADAAGDAPLLDILEDRAVISRLSADGAMRLRRVAPVLIAAWQARGGSDLATGIGQCWQRLGGEEACLDAAELAAGRQYLLALRELQEREGRPSAAQLQALAARLKDREVPAGKHPVEVLTIHHAKGLEWDVVFVPGLGKRPRADTAPLLRWLQLPRATGGTDLLLAVHSIGAPRSTEPLAAYIRRLQAERARNERLRLLYVAVTRARLRLYLSGHAPLSRQVEQPLPRAGSLLDLLWPAVRDEYLRGLASMAPAAAHEPEPQPLRMLWHRVPADFRPGPARTLPVPDSLTPAPADASALVEYSWVGPLARASGTAMHVELERLARLGEGALAELPQRAVACALRLRELGIAPAAARAAAQALITRLAELAGQEQARWLLFTAHRGAATELPLSGLVDGELRSVVLDRTFIDADGQRWIIDYKTGVHSGGDLEQFVARELERYTPQLELYASLAAQLGSEPVRAALFFPWLGVLRELPAVN